MIALAPNAVFIPHNGLSRAMFGDRPVNAVPLPSMRMICRIAHIQAVVAKSYGIHLTHMKSDARFRSVAWPRQVAMYLARELTGKALPCIGREFGKRDHTTVMYAIKAVQKRMDDDTLYRADVEALREALR